MKLRDSLDAIEAFPVVALDAIVGRDPFVVLSPHPDDESLGCGGLIAAACERGQSVRVVVLTDGSGSHPGSKTHPPERVAALRQAETTEAAAALGLRASQVTHFGLRDTAAPTAGPIFDAAVDAVDRLVGTLGATTLFVTWRHDPHCDHEAAALMADAVVRRRPALRLWHYPIWGLHRSPDDWVDDERPEGVQLDIWPWQDRKRAAIRCHASQMTDVIADDPSGFRFTNATLAPFLARHERFIRVSA